MGIRGVTKKSPSTVREREQGREREGERGFVYTCICLIIRINFVRVYVGKHSIRMLSIKSIEQSRKLGVEKLNITVELFYT
jgi:hypothetical protein